MLFRSAVSSGEVTSERGGACGNIDGCVIAECEWGIEDSGGGRALQVDAGGGQCDGIAGDGVPRGREVEGVGIAAG